MYFDRFPRVLYDFPINGDGTSKFVSVTDITRNVRFTKEFIDKLNVYEIYRMQNGETIEMVSEMLYGTPEYHWVLMLINQRYNYVEDFPLDQVNFDRVMETKYGRRKEDVKYFINSSGIRVTPECSFRMTNTEDPVIVGKFLFDDVKTGTIIKRKTVAGTYIFSITGRSEDDEFSAVVGSGTLRVGDSVSLFNIDENGDQVHIGDSVIEYFFLSNEYNPISNYEYEMMVNESKRIIKIVPRPYISQIVNELESLISQ